MRLLAALLALAGLTQQPMVGAYHFVRYSAQGGYQKPIYEKFDLNALTNKTVPFFIVGDGLEKVAGGDNPSAVMSQILLAAKAWNGVATSDLRIAFGGYASNAGQPGQGGAPGIDVVFDEVPPGIISYAGPTVKAETNLNAAEPFTPILRSTIVFRKDLSNVNGVPLPSYSEAFLLNAVHEFGHALGLQHTFTSSAMSTQLTRATTRSKPIGPDDTAALSILYPSTNFYSLFGTFSGRVTQSGNGVNMASVVALSLNGTAVSTLTNPDGTYVLQGVPAGPYLVYAHPIPPPVSSQASAGDIVPPRDPENLPIAANNLFDLQFFPGTRDAQGAQTIGIVAGQTIGDLNFSVNRRAAPPTLFYPTTYSYFNNVAVRPAFITPQVASPLFVARGYGFVTADSKPIPNLKSTILGGSPAISSVRGWEKEFIIFDLFLSGFLSEGARHLVLDNGTESYVLPSAIQVASRAAPDVTNVNWLPPAGDGQRVAVISGTGFSQQSRVFIDGEEGTVRAIDEASGRITFVPPSAPTGFVGKISVLNSDGQSSLFVKPDAPAQIPFPDAEAVDFTISPNVLQAGIESVIEINSPGAHFQSGRVTAGFGSSDIAVKAFQVVSPTRILASVIVGAQTASGAYTATVQSGLNHLQLRGGLTIQAPNVAFAKAVLQPDPAWVTEAGGAHVSAGSNAIVQVAGLSGPAPRVTAALNDQPVTVLNAGGGRVTLQVPSTIQAGYALLRLQVDGENANPVLVIVAGAPPIVQRLEGADQYVVDAARPVAPGDTLAITFLEPNLLADGTLRANEIAIAIGENTVYTLQVRRLAPNTFQTVISVPKGLSNGSYPLSLAVNGRASLNTSLALRNR